VDVLIAGIITAVAVGVNIAGAIVWYYHGLAPKGLEVIKFEHIIYSFLGYCVTIVFLFLCLIARLGVQALRLKRRTLCLRILLVLGSVLIVVVVHTIFGPGYIHFTRGFFKRMQKEADIPAIRTWASSLELPRQDRHEVDDTQWPEAIKQLSPQYTFIEMPEDSETKVRIVWGGAFGHWGLMIGPSTMQVPPSNFRKYGEYRIKLAPGAYVWHDVRHEGIVMRIIRAVDEFVLSIVN
jgi:hypothetical protein